MQNLLLLKQFGLHLAHEPVSLGHERVKHRLSKSQVTIMYRVRTILVLGYRVGYWAIFTDIG